MLKSTVTIFKVGEEIQQIQNYELSTDTTLLNGRVKWAKGFNHDDVTISHFLNGKVKASEFFLFGTLANENVKKLVYIR
jgi:hypothetical protein